MSASSTTTVNAACLAAVSNRRDAPCSHVKEGRVPEPSQVTVAGVGVPVSQTTLHVALAAISVRSVPQANALALVTALPLADDGTGHAAAASHVNAGRVPEPSQVTVAGVAVPVSQTTLHVALAAISVRSVPQANALAPVTALVLADDGTGHAAA